MVVDGKQGKATEQQVTVSAAIVTFTEIDSAGRSTVDGNSGRLTESG